MGFLIPFSIGVSAGFVVCVLLFSLIGYSISNKEAKQRQQLVDKLFEEAKDADETL